MTKLVLVYQVGIANVIEQTEEGPKRLLQGAFFTCEAFLRGAAHAGADVDVAGCNMAGDILHLPWTRHLDDLPFSDQFGCKELQKRALQS